MPLLTHFNNLWWKSESRISPTVVTTVWAINVILRLILLHRIRGSFYGFRPEVATAPVHATSSAHIRWRRQNGIGIGEKCHRRPGTGGQTITPSGAHCRRGYHRVPAGQRTRSKASHLGIASQPGSRWTSCSIIPSRRTAHVIVVVLIAWRASSPELVESDWASASTSDGCASILTGQETGCYRWL